MRLYLVQHAPSVSKTEDPHSPLSEAGRRAAHKLAAHISQFPLSIDVIEHSEAVRAQQTAELLDLQVRPTLGSKQVEGMGPAAPVGPLVERLSKEQKDVMLVGHLPHLNTLANKLLGVKAGEGLILFQMGGCLCLERSDRGRWGISWMLTPDLLPKEEEERSRSSDVWDTNA